MLPRRRMIGALLTVIFVSSAIIDAKECGDNPMKQVLMVAKRTGRTLDHVLTVLRQIDAPAYEVLAKQFRLYAACVGLVDTGYFRKRSQAAANEMDSDHVLSSSDKISSPQKRRVVLLDLATHQNDGRYEDIPPPEEDISAQLRLDASNEQRLADAADLSRSLLSLVNKAKMILQASKVERRGEDTNDLNQEEIMEIPENMASIEYSLEDIFE